MNILSLFGGIECGRVALDELLIPVDKYFSSEIDPYAIKITKANYPDIVHIGDVRAIEYDHDGLTWVNSDNEPCLKKIDIDLLIGGSPCQDLSIAKAGGKGLDGEKSGLFYEYVRILREVKPKYFLLENVASMRQADKEKMTAVLKEVYPDTEVHMINSALVSAQNRKRLYWTNIPGVEQPMDQFIYLQDILEDIPMDDPRWKPLDEKYLTDKLKLQLREKSLSITASYHKKNAQNYFEKSEGQIIVGIMQKPRGKNQGGIIKDSNKSPTVTSSKFQDNNFVVNIYNQRLMLDKCGTLGTSNSLTSKQGYILIDPTDNIFFYRKLTPLECERLQTLPDNYTAHVSDSRRYKAIGNGWTVNVVRHILSFIPRSFLGN